MKLETCHPIESPGNKNVEDPKSSERQNQSKWIKFSM